MSADDLRKEAALCEQVAAVVSLNAVKASYLAMAADLRRHADEAIPSSPCHADRPCEGGCKEGSAPEA